MIVRLWQHRFVRPTTYAMVVIFAVIAAGAWYFGIWGRDDLIAYYGMSKECHPVWKDLALRQVYHGQPIDEVIERTNPVCVTRHGRFVQVDYQDFSFTGVQIVAIDGRAVRGLAASCTWDHQFFDGMSEKDVRELQASYQTDERTVTYRGKSDGYVRRASQLRTRQQTEETDAGFV